MNREIKFRAWDKEYEKMTYFDDEDYSYSCPEVFRLEQVFKKDCNYNDYEDFRYEDITDEVELMQYTGLHDKNGKEIYEGDIVTSTDYPFIDEGKQNYIGIVEYYEDIAQFGFTLKCVNKNKRGISNGFNEGFEANNDLICEDLEIIGNIYDNPELLKED